MQKSTSNSGLISVKEEAVKEVIQIAEMFERHREGVCNALCYEQSNARAERINGNDVQEVKTVGRGYRKFKNFRSAILFFHGGLELPWHNIRGSTSLEGSTAIRVE